VLAALALTTLLVPLDAQVGFGRVASTPTAQYVPVKVPVPAGAAFSVVTALDDAGDATGYV
jgi:hypothetical protein